MMAAKQNHATYSHMTLSHIQGINLLLACILFGCTPPPSTEQATESSAQTTEFRSGETVSTPAQLNQLMKQAAMNMAPTLTFFSKEDADKLVKNSLWNSYSRSYRYAQHNKGQVSLTLELSDATRILAAFRNPALTPQLSDREKQTLAKARSVVQQCRVPGNNFDTIINLHDYLIHNGETIVDGSASDSAASLLLRGKGDCWAYSQTFGMLLEIAGISNYVVTGTAHNRPHAWNLVKLDNEDWYHIDTTWDNPIIRDLGNNGFPSHRYFLICDFHMARNHRWQNNIYPKSGTRHATYFKQRHIFFSSFEDFWHHAIDAFLRNEEQFEGWLDFVYRDDDFKASLQQAVLREPRLRNCGWLAPDEGTEGSLRIIFR